MYRYILMRESDTGEVLFFTGSPYWSNEFPDALIMDLEKARMLQKRLSTSNTRLIIMDYDEYSDD